MTTKEGGLRGSIRNIGVGVGIPDSAIHRWKFDEGTGTTATDSIGTFDGSINGPSWVSGTYIGGNALSGDGTDDEVDVGLLGSWGSSMNTNLAVSFTMQTTDDSPAYILGTINNGGGTTHHIGVSRFNTGELLYWHRDESGNQPQVETDGFGFADGNKHRVVCNKTGNSDADFEVWVDGVEQSLISQNSGTISDPADFDNSMWFFARNGADNKEYFDGVLDDIIFYNDSLSSSEIQNDYNRQPWS